MRSCCNSSNFYTPPEALFACTTSKWRALISQFVKNLQKLRILLSENYSVIASYIVHFYHFYSMMVYRVVNYRDV